MTVNCGTVLSNVGKVRSNNQDSAYSGHELFVVADGMGGHAGGDIASSITINRLVNLDHAYDTIEDARLAFRSALLEANRALSMTVLDYPELTGMGTTVSGIIALGDVGVIAHIGDSRVYRFRDGRLEQITKDHTFVQRLVDAGRITPEEALVHPRRSVIMRVLGDIDANPEIDTIPVDLRPGDRWLICSDGLSGPVQYDEMSGILRDYPNRDAAAARLLQAALDHGAPDNVTVLLLDPVVANQPQTDQRIVGSAANPQTLDQLSKPVTASTPVNARLHIPSLPSLRHPLEPTHFESSADDYLEALIAEDRRRTIRRRIIATTLALVAIAALVFAAIGGYRWTQSQYFLGESNGKVAVFQGVSTNLGPIELSHVITDATIPSIAVTDLPFDSQVAVKNTVPVASFDEALQRLNALKAEATAK